MIPKPTCLQSRTLSLCSFKGWRDKPSSSTSFNARVAILTALMNSFQSNFGWSGSVESTNSAKFIAPRRQLPPAGNGSSIVLSQRLFIRCIWNFRSYSGRIAIRPEIRLSIQTSLAYIFIKPFLLNTSTFLF